MLICDFPPIPIYFESNEEKHVSVCLGGGIRSNGQVWGPGGGMEIEATATKLFTAVPD